MPDLTNNTVKYSVQFESQVSQQGHAWDIFIFKRKRSILHFIWQPTEITRPVSKWLFPTPLAHREAYLGRKRWAEGDAPLGFLTCTPAHGTRISGRAVCIFHRSPRETEAGSLVSLWNSEQWRVFPELTHWLSLPCAFGRNLEASDNWGASAEGFQRLDGGGQRGKSSFVGQGSREGWSLNLPRG